MVKRLVNGKAIDTDAFDARVLAMGIAAVRAEIGPFLCGSVDKAGEPICRKAAGMPCICEDIAQAVLDAGAEAARGLLK